MVCRRRSAGRARCACVSAACAPCDGFAAGFFEPIGEHGFGVIGRPLVGQHVVETRIVVMQAEQQFAEVGPRLDPTSLGAGEDREQDVRPRPGLLAAQEQPVFAAIAWWRSVRSLTLLSIDNRPSAV